MTVGFEEVTELSGEEVTQEQVERLCHRYVWAKSYCNGKDVLELACGTGQGLGYLKNFSKSIQAGDLCLPILERAQRYYQGQIPLYQLNAQKLPFAQASIDTILLFEAIYYLPAPREFIRECKRVLRPQGSLLIATANKDLNDFNPSPLSHTYFGVVELCELLSSEGMSAEFFGHLPVGEVSWRQKVFRPLKAAAVRTGLMPKTMTSKKLLKRIVFGNLVPMPAVVDESLIVYQSPLRVPSDIPDKTHKVLYGAAHVKNHG